MSANTFESAEPLYHHCQQCPKTEGLLACNGCKTAYYCSKDHQKSDWDAHKSFCKAIRKYEAMMAKEEHKLRTNPPDMFEPPNPFEGSVGVG